MVGPNTRCAWHRPTTNSARRGCDGFSPGDDAALIGRIGRNICRTRWMVAERPGIKQTGACAAKPKRNAVQRASSSNSPISPPFCLQVAWVIPVWRALQPCRRNGCVMQMAGRRRAPRPHVRPQSAASRVLHRAPIADINSLQRRRTPFAVVYSPYWVSFCIPVVTPLKRRRSHSGADSTLPFVRLHTLSSRAPLRHRGRVDCGVAAGHCQHTGLELDPASSQRAVARGSCRIEKVTKRVS